MNGIEIAYAKHAALILKQAMREKNINNSQLSRISGVPRGTIINILKGESQFVLSIYGKLCYALEMDIVIKVKEIRNLINRTDA